MSSALKVVPKEIQKASFDVAVRSEFFTELISRVLSRPVDRERFVQDLIVSVNSDPSLLNCEKLSLVSAGLQAKQYNLRIGDASGHAYLVPYNNRRTGTTEAQFQIGYKGLIQLALRTGKYVKINVTDVREGEIEYVDYLMEEHKFNWIKPKERLNLPVVGYAAVIVEKSGFHKTIYVTKEEVESHAQKYSQAYNRSNSSPWTTEFDKMAKKTVLKLLLGTYGQVSPELEAVMEADQSVIHYDEQGNPNYEYVDVTDVEETTTVKRTGKDAFVEAQVEDVSVKDTIEGKEDEKAPTKPTTVVPKPEVPSASDKVAEDEKPVLSEDSKAKLERLKAKRGRPRKTETTETSTQKSEDEKAEVSKPSNPNVETKGEVKQSDAPKSEVKLDHKAKLAELRARWQNK